MLEVDATHNKGLPMHSQLHCVWTREDEQLLGVERGVPAPQTTWEAFMALLAVRQFGHSEDMVASGSSHQLVQVPQVGRHVAG